MFNKSVCEKGNILFWDGVVIELLLVFIYSVQVFGFFGNNFNWIVIVDNFVVGYKISVDVELFLNVFRVYLKVGYYFVKN